MSDDSGEVVPYHHPDIVKELEELLEQAKTGKIVAFAYTAKRNRRKDKWLRNSFGDDGEGIAGSLMALLFGVVIESDEDGEVA